MSRGKLRKHMFTKKFPERTKKRDYRLVPSRIWSTGNFSVATGTKVNPVEKNRAAGIISLLHEFPIVVKGYQQNSRLGSSNFSFSHGNTKKQQATGWTTRIGSLKNSQSLQQTLNKKYPPSKQWLLLCYFHSSFSTPTRHRTDLV